MVARGYGLGLMTPPLPQPSVALDQTFEVRLPLAGAAPAAPKSVEEPLFEGEYDAREAELLRNQRGER